MVYHGIYINCQFHPLLHAQYPLCVIFSSIIIYVCLQRLQEYQNEFKTYREVKDNELAKERDELSSYRRNLESQLRYSKLLIRD